MENVRSGKITWYKMGCAFKSASKAWHRAPLITFFCFNQKSIYINCFLLVMATCTKQLSTSCGKKLPEGFAILFLSVRLPVLFRPTELP